MPAVSACARTVSSFASWAVSFGGGVGVALGFVVFDAAFLGEGESPPLSPQAAKATATAARAVQRVMATGEDTMSEFPNSCQVSRLSDAKLVR